ncbi:hypothetical protein HRbin01_01244 [archaeon HR01]|nr:hypothetical protein HRbin01_01244 [archaeon HR01]
MGSKGLSYIVGVLLVLSITVAAVGIYTVVASQQSNILSSLTALDIYRTRENLVVVQYHRASGQLVLYNNGQVPTCLVEVVAVGVGTVYSNPSCNLIDPLKTDTITLTLTSPPPKITLVARTINNKILTYTIS